LPTAGARPIGESKGDGPKHAATASARYTPPVPVYMQESPKWVPILMFALWILGALVIILYYLGAVPGGREQWQLLVGLAMILGGLYTATKFK
jgi:Cell division protein CrgA